MTTPDQAASERENFKTPERPKESNNYGIVKSVACFSWICPECFKINHMSKNKYLHHKGVDECAQCERAINVMEPT